MPSLDTLQTRLGLRFADVQLLRSALVHRSFLHEHPDQGVGLADGERLEFLGDAILNYLAATLLYDRFPSRSEGELTGLRSALVRTATLAGFARFDLWQPDRRLDNRVDSQLWIAGLD
jgi:ribonuclease-3